MTPGWALTENLTLWLFLSLIFQDSSIRDATLFLQTLYNSCILSILNLYQCKFLCFTIIINFYFQIYMFNYLLDIDIGKL